MACSGSAWLGPAARSGPAWLRSSATEFAVSLSRMVPMTRLHRSSFRTRLVPCSTRNSRSASSRRIPAVIVATAVSGACCRTPRDQSTAWVRYAAPRRKASARSSPTVALAPARPEQHPDHEAHRAADRDVLDPQQAYLPAGPDEQVEQHDHGDREGRLADRERSGPGA